MPAWEGFEENRSYVLEQLRKGFLDYVEILSHVTETRFFEFFLGNGYLEALAQSYPTPRKKEEVPLLVYLASELSLRLHGATGFSAYPFVIHAGGLKEALRQAVLKQERPGGRERWTFAGYNKKNAYERTTPCDQDFLRKLAKDTQPERLMHWFGHAAPALYRKMGMIDDAGIFVVDGSYLFVPDNPRYEDSAVGFFDEHNHLVGRKDELTPEALRRCRYRRYYGSVSLLHTNPTQNYFLYTSQRVLRGAASENPPMGSMVEQAVQALGGGKIKTLIHDRGFIDGRRTGRLNLDHGIDSVFPLKAGMQIWEDAKTLAELDERPWQVWRPSPPPAPAVPPQRPGRIRRREERRQHTLRARREQAAGPAEPSIDRVELKAIRYTRLWEACEVPLHVVVLRKFLTNGERFEWGLATTRDFTEPLEIWNLYQVRPSIEERHRQLKCFWDLTHFRSPDFALVVNQVIFSVLTYSLMQVFLHKAQREELTGVTRRRLLEQLLPDGEKVTMFYNNYVGYFTATEYSEELLGLTEGPRRRLLGTIRRLRRNALRPPPLPTRS